MAILEPAMEIIKRYSDLKDLDAFLFPLLNLEHENDMNFIVRARGIRIED